MILVIVIYTLVKHKEINKKFPLYLRFINRFLLDLKLYDRKKMFGFWLYCGKQGGGKTYNIVSDALELSEDENTVLISNVDLSIVRPYYRIHNVDEIIYSLDCSKQNIVLLDEIQTLLDSRNFNKDFYSLFCQLRKRNVLILGTAQVFSRVAKPLREQVSRLFFCKTFFNCLTYRRELAVLLNSECDLSRPVMAISHKIIVQCDAVRSAYDTRQTIGKTYGTGGE